MKKLALLISLLLVASSVPASAFYPINSPVASDSMLTDTMKAGKIGISADIQYLSPTDAFDFVKWSDSGLEDAAWATLDDLGVESMTIMVVPLSLAYGIADNVAVRATIPFIQTSFKPDTGDEASGSGIGNVKVETLWQVNPTFAANLGVVAATGKYFGQWGDTELPIADGSSSMTLSGIFQNRFDKVTVKGVLGYQVVSTCWGMLIGEQIPGISPANRWLFSGSVAYNVQSFQIGAELWGAFAGKESWLNSAVKCTEISAVFGSLFGKVNVSDTVYIRGSVDMPLSQSPSVAAADMMSWQVKGMLLNLGVGMTI